MQPTILSAVRNVALLILAVVALAGCNRQGSFTWTSSNSSWSEWVVNGKRTITRKENGITRKVETTADVEIQNGHVTKFPKAALVKLEESGGPQQRQAELRENGGNLELWIKDNDGYRRSSPEEDTWLDSFLSDVARK